LISIDLSANNFASQGSVFDPELLFQSLSTLVSLKSLNLSRNKLSGFHFKHFPEDNITAQPDKQVFPNLQILNFSFNNVESESSLFYCASQLPMLQTLVVTGNPFAITGLADNFRMLHSILSHKGGELVNESLNQVPSYA